MKTGVAATTDTVQPVKPIPTKNIDSSWERMKSTTHRKTFSSYKDIKTCIVFFINEYQF
jgi:hypothetical protein